MSYSKFRIWKMLVVIFVSILVGWSIANDYALVPVTAVIAGLVVMRLLKRGMKEEIADERVFSVADKAAMLVFRVFILLACMASATMLALKRENTDLEQAGLTLAFSVCVLLVVYYLAFIYYNRKYGG